MSIKIKIANEQDYGQLQGGVPRVIPRGPKTALVIHDYPGGNSAIVATRREALKKRVALNTPAGPRLFVAALIWDFHGQPCEQMSLRNGGKPYPRIRD